MDQKRTEAFIKYVKGFQFTDLIAFGTILGVKEEKDFSDYLTNIIVAFNDESRQKRKQLLKLARETYLANKDLGVEV